MKALITKIKSSDISFSAAAAISLLIVLFAILSGPMYAIITGIILIVVIGQFLMKERKVFELRNTREDLERSNELLEATEVLSGSGGWEFNIATRDLYWTKEMYRLHGADASYVPSMETVREFYTIDSRELIREIVRQAAESAKSFVVEAELLPGKDQKRRYVRTSVAPVIVDGKVVLLRGAVMDITSQKENEAKLLMIKDDLEKSNQHMSRVMKIVAHDLRNPINGIIGLSSLMLHNKNLVADDREALHLIIESGERSKRLISDIMGVTSMHEGVMVNPKETEIKGMLKRLVRMLQFVAGDKDLVLRLDAQKAVMANIDEDKIARVISNVISNAIKFSPQGKFIDIKLTSTDRKLLVSIKDFGIGIPPEISSRVFDMFTSAKRMGTSGEKPYGLGLHISKSIVEAHQGKIWLESGIESGTTFYIELPLDALSDMSLEKPRFMLYG